MKTNLVSAVCALVLSSISLTAHSAILDFVLVGNAGNFADTLTGNGAVSYEYAIGKTEVTNAQYASFLNAVGTSDPNALYNASMGSDVVGGIVQSGSAGSYTYTVKANMGNKPVNYVSVEDNKRFANWMHNGMPTGVQDATTTEDGAYNFATGGSVRESGAQVWLPNQDEWYKAAYHDPVNPGADGAPVGELNTIDYWYFPTMSDVRPDVAFAGPTGDVIGYWDFNSYPDTISPAGPNTAIYASEALDALGDDFNIGFWWPCSDDSCESVGSVGQTNSPSYWGTFDQAGNLRENLEINRSMGGGYPESESHQEADSTDEPAENGKTGFRVAGVPELVDTDRDGVADNADNCIVHPNGPLIPDAGGNSQLDTDMDGYGNLCDADLNQTGFVDFDDLTLFSDVFFSTDADADFNGTGFVDFDDLTLFSAMFFQAPGPSCCAP